MILIIRWKKTDSLMGYSFRARCLIVVHCCRELDAVIRLISARPATAHEEKEYWRLR